MRIHIISTCVSGELREHLLWMCDERDEEQTTHCRHQVRLGYGPMNWWATTTEHSLLQLNTVWPFVGNVCVGRLNCSERIAKPDDNAHIAILVDENLLFLRRTTTSAHLIVELSTNLPAHFIAILIDSNELDMRPHHSNELKPPEQYNWWQAFNLNRNQLEIKYKMYGMRNWDLFLRFEHLWCSSRWDYAHSSQQYSLLNG